MNGRWNRARRTYIRIKRFAEVNPKGGLLPMTDGQTVRSLRGKGRRLAPAFPFGLHVKTLVLEIAVERSDLSAIAIVELRRDAFSGAKDFFG